MIDVNDITAKLAQLPDAALQQYAQMHKGDPYMVSLAISESNRRKAVRQAAQPQGMAPQGSVVDQAISGIAMLPAQNMQDVGMADGGIVAFADGAYVSRPPRETTLQERMEAAMRPQTRSMFGLSSYRTPIADERRLRPASGEFADEPPARKPLGYSPEGDFPVDPALLAALQAGTAPEVKPASLKEDKPAAETETEKDEDKGPKLPAVRRARTAEEIYKDLQTTRTLVRGEDKPEEDEIRKRMSALAKTQKEGLAALIEKDKAARPTEPALEEREKKLREAEERAPEDRQQAISEALVRAGFGMMATQRPDFFGGVGEGLIRGFENYQSSMKDLKAAAEKREDLLDKIELTRRAEAQGDADRAFKYGEMALKSEQELESAQIKFLMDDLKFDRETAKAVAEFHTKELIAERNMAAQLGVAGMYAGGRGGSSDVKNYLAALNAERNRINSAISLNKSKPQFDPKVIEEKKQLDTALSELDSRINALQAKLAAEAGLPTTPAATTGARPGYDPSTFQMKTTPGR